MPAEIAELATLLKSIDGKVDGLGRSVAETQVGLKATNERVDALIKAHKTRSVSLPGVNEGENAGKFSFQRLIWAIATKDWRGAEFEKDVVDQATQKILAAGTDTAGGFIVPTEYVAELIELLRAKSVLDKVGVTPLTGLTGSPVEFPKQTGGATAFWVGENVAITPADQAFGMVKLTPHGLGAMTKMSNKLLRLSNPSVEAVVRDDLAKVMALKRDLGGLRGTGASEEPLGVANTAGINTTAMAATPTLDLLYAMLFELETDNADEGSIAWVMHPRTWHTLRKIKDGDGRYILIPDPVVKGRMSLFGYPIFKTTQIPTNLGAGANESELYLANWADLLAAEWGGLEIMASMETSDAFEKNQTWIRIIHEVDYAVRHAESFVLDKTVRP